MTATGGQQHDDDFYDAGFDHEFDEGDAELDTQMRQHERERISRHGDHARQRQRNLPQGRSRIEFNSGILDHWRDRRL